MSQDTSYEFTTEIPVEFAEAEKLVREALAAKGFGVLTEIDVRSTMKTKLDVDFRPYRILGACNPQLALGALGAEPGIGVLLPCNVVIEYVGQVQTRIRFMEPVAVLEMVSNPEVVAIAQEASSRLHQVAQQLADNH